MIKGRPVRPSDVFRAASTQTRPPDQFRASERMVGANGGRPKMRRFGGGSAGRKIFDFSDSRDWAPEASYTSPRARISKKFCNPTTGTSTSSRRRFALTSAIGSTEHRGSRGSSGSSEMGGISALLIRYSPHASRETAPAAGRPPDRPPESRDAFLSLLPHW